jgi:hypothetical protein
MREIETRQSDRDDRVLAIFRLFLVVDHFQRPYGTLSVDRSKRSLSSGTCRIGASFLPSAWATLQQHERTTPWTNSMLNDNCSEPYVVLLSCLHGRSNG